jgi:hypothetical protein
MVFFFGVPAIKFRKKTDALLTNQRMTVFRKQITLKKESTG